MDKVYAFLIVVICWSFSIQVSAQTFSYFGDTITVHVPSNWISEIRTNTETTESIMSFPSDRDIEGVQSLGKEIRTILDQKDITGCFQLGFLRQFVSAALSDATIHSRLFLEWMILTELDYRCFLAYSGEELYLFLRSDSPLRNHEYYEIEEGKRYFLIGSTSQIVPDNLRLRMNSKRDLVPFDFIPKGYPVVKNSIYALKTIRYHHLGRLDSLEILVNKTRREMMIDVPEMPYWEYVQMPIDVRTSEMIRQGLFPEGISVGDSIKALKKLLAVIRSGIPFEENDTVGYYMTADEALASERADCEDRVAVLYQISSSIFPFESILIEMEGHLSIAVGLHGDFPNPIVHHGKTFYIVDPSIDDPDFEIGDFPSDTLEILKIMALPTVE